VSCKILDNSKAFRIFISLRITINSIIFFAEI
jgi:hypothetical protein